MAFSSDADNARGDAARSQGAEFTGGGWTEADEPTRDWKKLVLVAGLGALSWVATYVGMLELIEANMGELPLVHKLIIGFSVAMLMVMIVWLLDQMFAPIGWFTKLCYAAGYVFLTVISVGFGFGFYWKVLESRSEASRSAESAVGQVQASLHAASTRLEQLQATLDQLTVMSRQKAEAERASGNTCPGSKPGDGPRRKQREDDAGRFAFAAEFVKGRVGQVKADMGALDGDLAKITKEDKSTVDARSGNRNEFMKALGRKLDLTVTGFNAFRTDPQLKQMRTDLAERAEKATFPDSKGGTFACPDGQLQTALRGVVRAIDQLPELEKPKIAAVEGSEATIEAFRRLTATFYGLLSFKLPMSADELRAKQQQAVQSVEAPPAAARASAGDQAIGLSKRDYVPLAIAIFVDLCLLLVSMGRPVNRLHGLVPRMKAAERGPFYQIVSKFNDIHKDPETRDKFEMFRHVVFDFNGDYYVAVPLDAPYRLRSRNAHGQPEKEYTRAVEDLQREAHLLSNLFASFEKERIFSRVYNPLLTTKTIQRKLWRQGSKYAGSQAFRVYRFRDGAWSEIILNVVLGAARRVEVERRSRRREEGPTLGMPRPGASSGRSARMQINLDAVEPAAMEQPAPHPLNGRVHPTVDAWATTHPGNATVHRSGEPTKAGWPQQSTVTTPRSPDGSHNGRTDTHHEARFGPYAGYVPQQAGHDRGKARHAAPLMPASSSPDAHAAPSRDYREIAAAFDAYSRARAAVREAEVSFHSAANSNTAPPARPPSDAEARAPAPTAVLAQNAPAAVATETAAPPADQVASPSAEVIALPYRAPSSTLTDVPQHATPIRAVDEHASGMVDVVMSRETAVFSVPVSEATMPQSLQGLLRQAVVGGQTTARIEATDATAQIAQALAGHAVDLAHTGASVPAVRGGEIAVRVDPPRRRADAEIDIDAISQRFAPLAKVIPAE